MATRICSKCGQEKDIEEFPLRNQFTHRRQSYCKDCLSVMEANWYERNKVYQKQNARMQGMNINKERGNMYGIIYPLTPVSTVASLTPMLLNFTMSEERRIMKYHL